MQVRFSDLGRDWYGRLEPPALILLKPHDEIIGPLGAYFGLHVELKYNEPSVVTFTYPSETNGFPSLFYEQLVKDKQVQIDPFGVFVVMSANETDDGVRKVKEVTLNSREVELGGKQLVFAAGTYNLWNPADQENTMLGLIAESAPSWKIGYVSPSLIGRYRTFDETDEKALDWMHGTAQDTYGCLFVYDSFNRIINVYDVADAPPIVPVYLSYQNLLIEGTISELEDTFPTMLYVKGADGVDIRNVNPTGDNFIYNLDYYLGNGDISGELANKWRTWQNAIFARQPYYTSLVALRNAATARKIAESARLTDLKNELATLDNTRATFLQMQKKVGPNSDSWQYFQDRLDETGEEYTTLQADIENQEDLIETIQSEIDTHAASIVAVNKELDKNSFFSAADMVVLDKYLRQDTFEDTSFAVFDVSLTGSDSLTDSPTATIRFDGVTLVDIECEGAHRMSAIKGGTVTLTGADYSLTANIVSATLDHKDDEVICSIYLGSGKVNEDAFTGGNLTCVCRSSYNDDAMLAGMTKHAETQTSHDGSVSRTSYYYTGDASIPATDGSFYFTKNATDYQRYSVQQELYDYAAGCHKELAYPAYEFEVDSGNFIADRAFEPFKDAIQLGCSCYLQLEKEFALTPILTEIHFNFEDLTDFKLIFASEYRRPDDLAKMKKTMKDITTSSRTFDSRKYAYGANNNTTTWVQQLFINGFDTAMAQINAGKDNMVTIDNAGIKVSSADGIDTIYLNNGMIALVDKRTNTVNMAMGHFYNEASGTDFIGILGDIIGGTLLAGKNLIIECPDPNGGVMQFKVDSSGVILNNGRFYLRTDKGAMGMDANHGFFAGTKDLFTTTDTGYVHPVCIDEDGGLVFDEDGFPKDVNVWIGIDGKVYVRGNIYATDGVFNGTVYAKGGEFKGVVQASDFLDASGNSMLTSEGKFDAEYLDLMGINVKNSSGETVIQIDESGIKFSAAYPPITYQYSSDNANWHDTMLSTDKYRRESYDGGDTWNAGYQFVGKDGSDGSDANVPSYIKRTYIDATSVSSFHIKGNKLEAVLPIGSSYSDDLGFLLTGSWNGQTLSYMQICSFNQDTAPQVLFTSPDDCYCIWDYPVTYFKGSLDFSDADTTGLHLTFT